MGTLDGWQTDARQMLNCAKARANLQLPSTLKPEAWL